jgi:hypothetical protein
VGEKITPPPFSDVFRLMFYAGLFIRGAWEYHRRWSPAVRTLDSIIAASAEALRPLLREAFEAGRAEASADLKAKIADLLSVGQSTPSSIPSPGRAAPVYSNGRAAQGSIKPMIAKIIVESTTDGLTPGEITHRTGFKPNTVRGTIWTLGQEGAIVKRGNRWYSSSLPDELPDEDEL